MQGRGPLFLRGATTNPYDNLDGVMLGASPTANVRTVAEATRTTLQGLLFPRLVVVRGEERLRGKELDEALRQANLDFAFLTNEAGSELGATVRMHDQRLQYIAQSTFTPAFARAMEERRRLRAPLRGQHMEGLPALMGDISGGSMVELGAGDDDERILALQKFAQRAGADFICQDLTPAAARNGAGARPSIPYLAIPPHPAFFGGSLGVARHPHIWTMHNVLSSLGFSSAEDLFHGAQAAGVDRLVATHTLGLPNDSKVFPDGWKSNLASGDESDSYDLRRAMFARLQTQAVSALRVRFEQLDERLQKFLIAETTETYRLLCTELYKDFLCYTARSLKFPHVQCWVVTRSQQCSRADLLKAFPDLDDNLNVVSLTPFTGEILGVEEDLPADQAMLTTTEWHLVCSRTPLNKSPQLGKYQSASQHASSFLVDEKWRNANAIEFMLSLQSDPGQMQQFAARLPQLVPCARRAALKIVFEDLPDPDVHRFRGSSLQAFLTKQYTEPPII